MAHDRTNSLASEDSSTMEATVLDYREEGETRCYLCKATLEQYVSSLPDTYQEYDIQREIVRNVYLDRIVDTVLQRSHIPPIVLVSETQHKGKIGGTLKIAPFKILDGLQRTFRLQAIREVIGYATDTLQLDKTLANLNTFQFSRKFSQDMRDRNATTEILRRVLEYGVKQGEDALLESFADNYQWFEVWTGLTPDLEVSKMLTLNAGHKPVNTRHQMELLFLYLLPLLRKKVKVEFELVREKQIRSAQFSKLRKAGQIHFSHLIAALLSLHHGRPQVASAGLIQSIQQDDVGIEEYDEITTADALRGIIEFLLELDHIATDKYKEAGVRWMGREVTLAGLFGAVGKYAAEYKRSISKAMNDLLSIVRNKPSLLKLDNFEDVRNNLDLSKINFGKVNRTAVYDAIYDLLTEEPPSIIVWSSYFEPDDQ